MKASVLIIIAAIIYCLPVNPQTTTIRIGVFDSRAVGIAWFNSSVSSSHERADVLNSRMKEAIEKNDSDAIASLEREAKLRQAMQHEMAFGTGSIRFVLEEIKDKISQIAKENNLSVVVSKWEINCPADNVELVDITDKIADIFQPDERVKGWLKEMKNVEPVKEAYLIDD